MEDGTSGPVTVDDSPRVVGRRERPLRIGRRALRTRQRDRAARPGEEIDVELIADTSTCIDLTREAELSFVDLTNSFNINQDGHSDSVIDITSTGSNSTPDDAMGNLTGADDVIVQDVEIPVFDLVADDTSASASTSASSTSQTSTSAASAAMSPVGKGLSCPVCFDSDKTIKSSGRRIMSTTCGHVFCSDCIRDAIRCQGRCPSCRKKLSNRQVHPLFV